MARKVKHLLSGSELTKSDIDYTLELSLELKNNRYAFTRILSQKHLALMFDKPSLRTRMSFTLAMRELGGDVIESDSGTRKSEEPEDQMRVLQGYCNAVMIRTHSDSILSRMESVAEIPIINGLSEMFHPCQSLADCLTLKEVFDHLKGLTLCYLGDGNNVFHSLLLMAPKLGINIHYCCPPNYGPSQEVLAHAKSQASGSVITEFNEPIAAVKGSHAVYTYVWTSMGFEHSDLQQFDGFQVNESLMAEADKDAVFMHCMPMNRGQEVSASLPDAPCSVIFQQSENRLHVQKAMLYQLLY